MNKFQIYCFSFMLKSHNDLNEDTELILETSYQLFNNAPSYQKNKKIK